MVIAFFVLSSLNRAYIKNKVEGLVQEQVQATAEILKVNISHFIKENYPPHKILELYAREKNIYYTALVDEKKEILSWTSLFEGYLPLSLQSIEREGTWVIDSPVGKIFNFFSPFSPQEGKTYFLYLGYSLKNLEEMIAHSRRNFYFIFILIFFIGVLFFAGFYQLQSRYLNKMREAEEERKEKERYREISALTSGIAHEIKNPLNSLSLLVELLQKKVPEELKADVFAGKAEIHKISRIIDQFSQTLRPLKLKKGKFFLEELMLAVRERLAREFDTSRVEIRYEQSSPLSINADKSLIDQALLNILKNALEATESGLISVRAHRQKKNILIEISDTGRGIADEDKEHVFKPFFSGKKHGMGVGLYLAKKIVEAHEGEIGFESKSGEGTTFHIQIPGG